jgi:hypothetical protein
MQPEQLNQGDRDSDGEEEVVRVLPRHRSWKVKTSAAASGNQKVFLEQDEISDACVEGSNQQPQAQAGNFQEDHRGIYKDIVEKRSTRAQYN